MSEGSSPTPGQGLRGLVTGLLVIALFAALAVIAWQNTGSGEGTIATEELDPATNRPLVVGPRGPDAATGPAPPARTGSSTAGEAADAADPLAERALREILERRNREEARQAERARLASDSPLTPASRDLADMVVRPPERADADPAPGERADERTGARARAAPMASAALAALAGLADPQSDVSPRGTPGPAGAGTGQAPGLTAGATAGVAGGQAGRQSRRQAYVLARGAVIPTVLESAIDSDLPGLVRARVSGDVYDTVTGTRLLIPRGAALVGRYGAAGGAGRKRLFVSWTDLRLPDGTSLALDAFPALGADGAAGIRGRRSTGLFTALGAAVLFDLAGNATQILTGARPEQQSGDLGALIANATGNATTRVADQYLGQLLEGGPRFRVDAGAIMNVLVEQDLTLPARAAR